MGKIFDKILSGLDVCIIGDVIIGKKVISNQKEWRNMMVSQVLIQKS